MATVYLWRISSGQKRVGHLALLLNDDEDTYISFWPASGGKNALCGCTSTCHTYSEDVDAEGGSPDDSYNIPSSLLNLDRIRRWWNANNRNYSLLGNNCALTVYMALKEGGLKLFKSNTLANIGMFIRFPDDDDPDYEELQMRQDVINQGGLESLPVVPATAYSWIVDKVEEQKSGGGGGGSKCVCM